MGNINYKYINFVLVGLIIATNGYILISPLIPQFDLWRRKHQAAAVNGLPYKTYLGQDDSKNRQRQQIPKDERLIIPKIALDQHVYQGSNQYLVNKGVWAKPNSSTPPKGGNTVMVAHRFTYDGPATFYSLDKLTPGDKVVVYWLSKEYDYTVSSVKVVPPTAVEVENQTKEPQITLYTCTPIWSAKDRLVVVAQLDGAGR